MLSPPFFLSYFDALVTAVVAQLTGLLGERYGYHDFPTYSMEGLPADRFGWLTEYPTNRSITELAQTIVQG